MSPRDKARFWSKIKIDPATGCWVWTAAVRRWSREPWDGFYGAFWLKDRVERAHKVAWRILFGRWPRKNLLHGCDNRRCVNVLAHIREGTQLENVTDMLRKGRAKHQRKEAFNGQQR